MTAFAAHGPVFALVDNDVHSARLMKRVLASVADHVELTWLGDARRAKRSLVELFDQRSDSMPDLVIVDLKAHSSASADFVTEIRNHAKAAGVAIVAIVEEDAGTEPGRLRHAGADAVFVRHPDLAAYAAELEAITEFWVRETVTWPIRA